MFSMVPPAIVQVRIDTSPWVDGINVPVDPEVGEAITRCERETLQLDGRMITITLMGSSNKPWAAIKCKIDKRRLKLLIGGAYAEKDGLHQFTITAGVVESDGQ